MTSAEFNEKWSDYLVSGHYGLNIDHEGVIEYLDQEFTNEVVINPSFNYAQIKVKFGSSRVYASTDNASKWERKIDRILKSKS